MVNGQWLLYNNFLCWCKICFCVFAIFLGMYHACRSTSKIIWQRNFLGIDKSDTSVGPIFNYRVISSAFTSNPWEIMRIFIFLIYFTQYLCWGYKSSCLLDLQNSSLILISALPYYSLLCASIIPSRLSDIPFNRLFVLPVCQVRLL